MKEALRKACSSLRGCAQPRQPSLITAVCLWWQEEPPHGCTRCHSPLPCLRVSSAFFSKQARALHLKASNKSAAPTLSNKRDLRRCEKTATLLERKDKVSIAALYEQAAPHGARSSLCATPSKLGSSEHSQNGLACSSCRSLSHNDERS